MCVAEGRAILNAGDYGNVLRLLQRIYEKLGVENRTASVMRAFGTGLSLK